MLSSFSFVGAFSCSSLLAFLLLVSASGFRLRIDRHAFCDFNKQIDYSLHGVVFKFKFWEGGQASYKLNDKVVIPCPQHLEGSCTAECSNPGGSYGGWTFKNCKCVSSTECARYNPFKRNYRAGTVVFDFSKGYKKGERVTRDCPSGMSGTCVAECSEPGAGSYGGWTFEHCKCVSTTECAVSSTPFKRAVGTGTVVFDFSKAYTKDERITHCPAGMSGTCVAKCSEPGAANGGWTFEDCKCVPAECAVSSTPFKRAVGTGTVVFDFSKAYTKDEQVTGKLPSWHVGNLCG
eukprot:TRINITY_DN7073_c0_g1_i16.p1 TRINITY_DN7073_c0_g1~~TRINITY_DN7073_c0_g1_i16.p1  ORF type:complete len:291 (-),score=7.74 TRINITY_DN7073_c0_g1_i16:1-873(-)